MTGPVAAAYLRVSSASQDLGMQRTAVERLAAVHGETIERWYMEKVSAATIARPELDRLRADVRAGYVSHLYIFRLDRLARTGIRDTFEIVEELRAHNCKLTTVADGFTLEGPAAEIVLAVLAWAAKMERLAINERIIAARERCRLQGKPWGRPRRMTPELVEKAKQLRQEGRSVRAIAVALKTPRSTIMRALAEKKSA